jgi:hypothetical protein
MNVVASKISNETMSSSREMKSRESRSRNFWLVLILGLFGINLGIAVFAIAIAVGDSSLKPMPDYGQEAVGWQERQELLEASRGLGWAIDLAQEVGPGAGLRVKVRDRDGLPVTGCSGAIRVYHFTEAGKVGRGSVEEIGEGSYHAPLPLAQSGWWQVAVDLTADSGRRFIADQAWFLDEDGRWRVESP